MEKTEEILESLFRRLQWLNNSIEDEIIVLADRIVALKGELCRIDEMLGDLAKIAQQAKEHPS